jgi:hypothetical protein
MTTVKHSVPETDILIETIFWLIENGWTIDSVSFPRGQEMNSMDHHSYFKYRLEESSLTHIIHNITFPSNGPDILASKDEIKWKIECKGYSNSKLQTQRNNFDRALASCVTYFNDKENLKIGLAVPDFYKSDIQKRIPIALREALKMSIFLFDTKNNVIEHFEPNDVL